MTFKNPSDHGLTHKEDTTFKNLSQEELVKHAIEFTGAKQTPEGSIVVYTGKHTGRAAKDKYVVETALTNETIDWANNVHKLSPETFANIKTDVIKHINSSERFYWSTANVGSIENLAISAELFSTHPSHSLFFRYLMREDNFDSSKGFGHYTVFHAPTLQVDKEKHGTRSETVIAMDIENNEVLIAGTLYAGEIKKSLFSALNYMLPERGILPMHAGANIDDNKNVSIFFGLSGTGKTTLSTQEGSLLIGDDEHGLSDDGVFNFEGGCYAKTYKLSNETEPEIFAASNRFGALLENVVLNDKNEPDFFDKSIAENGRSAYPLSFIDGVEPTSHGPVAKDMFFLTADAFGVLPPVAKLNRSQSMYYFLSGYTAKLAGTEVGVTEPTATFSTCFGAPFMMRNAQEYADLLGHYIDKHNINVWLVNTGWTGGAYGVGERFPLKVTRRIIEAIQKNELNSTSFETEEFFGLSIPTSITGVDEKLLNAKNTWEDKTAYNKAAAKLAEMFHNNFKNFKKATSDVAAGGPLQLSKGA